MNLIFRSQPVSALGATTVWAPTAGLRWQLLGVSVFNRGTLGGPAAVTVTILDAATSIGFAVSLVPGAAALINQPPIIVPLPSPGYTSTADGNVLAASLSSAMSSGDLLIMVWGYEV